MTVGLVLGGTVVLLLGAVIGGLDYLHIGIAVGLTGVLMVVLGLIHLDRQESAAQARCEARGGTFADLRDSDLCFAPGVVLEVSR